MYPDRNLSQLPLCLPQISNYFMQLFTYYNYRGTSSIHKLGLNKGRVFSEKSNKLKYLKLNLTVFKGLIHAAEETHPSLVIKTNQSMLVGK